MHILSRGTLRKFWARYPDARVPLQAWHREVKRATWKTPADVKAMNRSVSILPNNRVVFNIKGNHYRLVVAVQYDYGRVYIRFVGTHQEYDRIDALSI